MELPLDFKLRMKEMLSDEYDDFLKELLYGENYFGMRINSLKKVPDELLEILESMEKIPWCSKGYYADKEILSGKSPYHTGGLIYFQEPSAMAVVEALEVQPGDYVLDLCAAPGGKSTQAAACLLGEGLLVANEIIPKRCMILSENIERMGIKNALVTNENPKNLSKKFPNFFNKIIVDAPCSGEGMFRKEPKALEEWSLEHTKSCAARQKLIIDSAISMLAPGGRLVYSTCTFSPLENEGVADYILSNYPDMKLLPIDLPGLLPGDGGFANSEFNLKDTKRIFPHKVHGEGHFIALFERSGNILREYKKTPENDSNALFRDFEKKFLNTGLKGKFVSFGENLYLLPVDIDIDKLKVERAGLYLGKCKKGRFEPAHALALALNPKDFKNTFNVESTEKYFRGETLSGDISGWCAICYNGFTVGWAKGSGGILKNHFPKYLRERR